MSGSMKRLLVAAPALVLAVAAVALAGGAVASGEAAVPAQPVATVAAPEGLAQATSTRDWQEVQGTPTQRRVRGQN